MSLEYLIALDLEATCGQKGPKEIIEFAAVLINLNDGDIKALFQKFVKPRDNPVLTNFCKNLTGIAQLDINNGVRLEDCLSEFIDWSKEQAEKYNFVLPGRGSGYNCVVASWSKEDIEIFLKSEFERRYMRPPPIFTQYVDLQAVYKKKFVGSATLKTACENLKGQFEGREHCGLDDAGNLAKLAYIMKKDNLPFKMSTM